MFLRIFILAGILVSTFLQQGLCQEVITMLPTIKSENISDDQLKQLIAKANAEGYSDEFIQNELLKRGLSSDEMGKIMMRVNDLRNSLPSSPSSPSSLPQQKARQIQRTELTSTNPKPKETSIFGLEWFSNDKLSFTPNLRMSTPTQYRLGPEDELRVDIHGSTDIQFNLLINSEGMVRYKYIPPVLLNGLSIEEAKIKLSKALSKIYPGLANGKSKLMLSLGNIRSIRITILGAVVAPGSYNVPSLTTLFNALYQSGGPLANGSLREVELIRNGKVVLKADLYKFLVYGQVSDNVLLHDDDVIRIPYAKIQVTLQGEVNKPAQFEMLAHEKVNTLLEYAGGFSARAFKNLLSITRITGKEQKMIDVLSDSLSKTELVDGDVITVGSVLDRFENRVQISGAVYRPGAYSLQPKMNIKDLIEKAEGLKEDAFRGRIQLARLSDDRKNKEFYSFSYDSIMLNPSLYNWVLIKDDEITVPSKRDLALEMTVQIDGAVKKPGQMVFQKGMTLEALLVLANGFVYDAVIDRIEVARVVRDSSTQQLGGELSKLFVIELNEGTLSKQSSEFLLEPYDRVTVRKDPYLSQPKVVNVSGEVINPGSYVLKTGSERVSSFLKRAGGLKYTANEQVALIKRRVSEKIDSTSIEQLAQSESKDSSGTLIKKVQLAINKDLYVELGKALAAPGSVNDLILEEGDELVFLKKNDYVVVSGEVYNPGTYVFEKSTKLQYFIQMAGGLNETAKKKSIYVTYANGKSKTKKYVLGFIPKNPKVLPGSLVVVPQKQPSKGFDLARAGIFISALSTLTTTGFLIWQITR